MAAPFQLDSDEQIVLEARRHWINIVPVWIMGVVMVIVAAALAYMLDKFRGQYGNFLPSATGPVLMLLIIALAVLITGVGLWVYTQNRLVLTTKHLIKVEQSGLFSRKVSQLALNRVQDVNGVRRGMLATILNFGSVEVQSAGEDEEFIFAQMPDPAGLADQLMKAHDQYAPGGSGLE